MKRTMIWSGIIVALTASAMLIWRDALVLAAMQYKLAPASDFSQATVPQEPDYALVSAWAARPDITDPSDFVPDGVVKNDAQKAAAVFFVHGTTFVSNAGWNAALNDPGAAQKRDELVLRGQASAFNLCCDVYVPKYRQATFWSFMEPSPSGAAALEVAYQDVADAFEVFQLEIGDQPFILAGHSQGSRHLLRLLEAEHANDKMGRLVVAYLPGIGIDQRRTEATLPDIPVCSLPEQSRCFVSWNAMTAEAISRHTASGDVCVNPLTWIAGSQKSESDANLGHCQCKTN